MTLFLPVEQITFPLHFAVLQMGPKAAAYRESFSDIPLSNSRTGRGRLFARTSARVCRTVRPLPTDLASGKGLATPRPRERCPGHGPALREKPLQQRIAAPSPKLHCPTLP